MKWDTRWDRMIMKHLDLLLSRVLFAEQITLPGHLRRGIARVNHTVERCVRRRQGVSRAAYSSPLPGRFSLVALQQIAYGSASRARSSLAS